MFVRSVLLATVLLMAAPLTVLAQSREDAIAIPVLRASVAVAGELVRIGDMIENAGTSAQIAIYRAPDLGTTGSLPTAQVIAALQAHQVIGVDTRNIKAVTVTRLSRAIEASELRLQVARALEHRNGLGDAANLGLTFDRDIRDIQLDATNTGPLQPVSARFEPRSGRFDVSFEIANDSSAAPVKLRFTGVAIETVEAAVLTRNVERNEILKSSDVMTERRPKAEVGSDPAARGQAVGMQIRRQLRAGQALRTADLAKPESGAARRQCHADLRIRRPLSHHPRQGARQWCRGRRRQRAQPAIQAHDIRGRDRPRTGGDHGRNAAASCSRESIHGRLSRHRIHFSRRQQRLASRSKSRVTFMYTSSINRIALTGTLLTIVSVAGGCSSIDRLSQIGEQPRTLGD